MFPLIFAMLLLDSKLLYSLSCGDRNGTCCYLHKWDTEQGKCIPCKNGYYGINCGIKCSFPHYGPGCISRCNCSVNECDNINGCKELSMSTSEIAKIVTARTSTNLSCNNGYQNDSTSMTPLLVGIIVLASTAFIIILMTFYAHRLEMRQKSRTEQKENVRT